MGSKQSSFADKKNKPSAKAAGKALSGERGRKTENSPERPRGVSGSVVVVNSTTFNPILSDTTTMKVAVVDDTPTLILNESNMDSDSEEEEKDQEFEDAFLERRRILEDAKALKQFAQFFHHPEANVKVDAITTARCFFDRPGAPERLSYEDAEEQALIMQDMAALKSNAIDFQHPERPVITTDPSACGRNYFDRATAPVADPAEEEERARVLADAAALKEQATFFLHPERPVETTDPCACGRNYFQRYSATQEQEDEEEKAQLLRDCAALKEQAGFFLHPERPVETTDSCACGRNYFQRYSAPEQEDGEAAMERAQVLQDCAALKETAGFFMHPEVPVHTTDPFACGRNYYSRPSAARPQEDDDVDDEERARVLEDCEGLRQKATDYLHPELPVQTTDPFACGRNYYSRPSAPLSEDLEESIERGKILEESRQLKQLVVDFYHPEIPVTTTDPFACGRNYFERPSASGIEDEVNEKERAAILADCQALKTHVFFYKHPENKVVTTDPYACGRNYYSRFSSPEQINQEESEERVRILEEAKLFGENAKMYRHPEIAVVTNDATAPGRNYFSRYNAQGHAHMVHTFPAHEDDDYHEEHHEHVEHWGMEEDEDTMFAEMRHSLVVPTQAKVAAGGEDEESNLSRSPSSVMLHMGESIYD